MIYRIATAFVITDHITDIQFVYSLGNSTCRWLCSIHSDKFELVTQAN